jgi:hypothetical protein
MRHYADFVAPIAASVRNVTLARGAATLGVLAPWGGGAGLVGGTAR